MAANSNAKRQHWTKQMKDWERSGLSQGAYCSREEIKYTTFDYWRKQFGAARPVIKPIAKTKATNQLTLVPVRLASKSPSNNTVLRSPGGWQLELPGTIDTLWLASLLRELP
jgi:transposase